MTLYKNVTANFLYTLLDCVQGFFENRLHTPRHTLAFFSEDPLMGWPRSPYPTAGQIKKVPPQRIIPGLRSSAPLRSR
jgi:hypothetical protein